jgi:hypothetical protein
MTCDLGLSSMDFGRHDLIYEREHKIEHWNRSVTLSEKCSPRLSTAMS